MQVLHLTIFALCSKIKNLNAQAERREKIEARRDVEVSIMRE